MREELERATEAWAGEPYKRRHLELGPTQARGWKKGPLLRKCARPQGILWAVALHLEEGELTNLQEELQSLLERIREALAEGASEEEIAAMLEELREKSLAYLDASCATGASALGQLGRRERAG